MNKNDQYLKAGIVLFSLVCIPAFYIAWEEPTTPDNLSVIPMNILLNSQNIKEKDKQLQALDSAKQIINSLLQKKPNDINLRYSQGIYYSFTGNYAEAISIQSNNLKALDSTDNKYLYENTKAEIARNFYMQGIKLLSEDNKNMQAAIKTMYKSFNYVPYYEPSVLKLALLNIENNRLDSAKMLLSECIKINPRDAVLYGTLGYACYKENNFKESQNFFLQAHNLNPDNEDVNKFLKMYQEQQK